MRFLKIGAKASAFGVALATAGCGGVTAPREAASTPPQASNERALPTEGDRTPAPGANATRAESTDQDTDTKVETGDPPPAPRELTYRVRSGALAIEVDDVEFDVSAKAVRSGRGFGVEVKVVAKLTGDSTRSILSPSRGPLAFAGTVRQNLFTDVREGDGEQVLSADTPLTFTRTWPESGVNGLAAGEELELRVGLWGLGHDAKSRQPIQQFFTVKMQGSNKAPTPVVTPPAAFTE